MTTVATALTASDHIRMRFETVYKHFHVDE